MGSKENNYIERYWRDATPADAIKDPPMVARFKYEDAEDWEYDLLVGWDRTDQCHWRSELDAFDHCQVYDAPEPKYVPFTWEDREQLRGRWITWKHENGLMTESQINHINQHRDGGVWFKSHDAKWLLENATFLDTGEPVGKRVV